MGCGASAAVPLSAGLTGDSTSGETPLASKTRKAESPPAPRPPSPPAAAVEVVDSEPAAATAPAAAEEDPPPPEPCPTDGVALWALRAFLSKHAALAAGKSTGAVCLEIAKPATLALRSAYIDLLRDDRSPDGRGTPAVAPATVFVSHAWGNPFESLVAAVESHLGGEADEAYVWIDILSELLCAVEGKTRLEVVLSPGEQATFLRALTDDFASIAASLSRSDARGATAFHARDKEMISAAVEASCGFTQLNATVASLLRAWLAACGERALAALPDAERAASTLAQQVAALLRDLGRLPEAEGLIRAALSVRRTALGAAHPDTLTALNNLGWVLTDMGRLAEAEEILRECVAARREVLGSAHPDTLYSINNLARVLAAAAAAAVGPGPAGGDGSGDAAARRHRAEAEALFKEVVASRRASLGPRHESTLISIANLAELLGAAAGGTADAAAVEAAAEAEALLREAGEGFRETLGPRHPFAVLALNSLANLLVETEAPTGGGGGGDTAIERRSPRRAEAEGLYRAALAGLIEQYGHKHADVLAVALNLAALLKEAGEGGDADAEVGKLAEEAARRRGELLPRRLRADLRGPCIAVPSAAANIAAPAVGACTAGPVVVG